MRFSSFFSKIHQGNFRKLIIFPRVICCYFTSPSILFGCYWKMKIRIQKSNQKKIKFSRKSIQLVMIYLSDTKICILHASIVSVNFYLKFFPYKVDRIYLSWYEIWLGGFFDFILNLGSRPGESVFFLFSIFFILRT